jgi:hypothetical protein
MATIFSRDAISALDNLGEDEKNYHLRKATWDAIDMIKSDPSGAQARRRVLRTPGGKSVWMVPIPVMHNNERWVILWQPRGNDILIPYIGPEDFHPSR